MEGSRNEESFRMIMIFCFALRAQSLLLNAMANANNVIQNHFIAMDHGVYLHIFWNALKLNDEL